VLVNVIGRTYRRLRGGHGWTPERAARGVADIALRGPMAGD
jgi:hypothetical protein